MNNKSASAEEMLRYILDEFRKKISELEGRIIKLELKKHNEEVSKWQ